MENMYLQFEGMAYEQKVGIPMGTNCAPLIADLFLFCKYKDSMSNLHIFKRYDPCNRNVKRHLSISSRYIQHR